MNFLFGLSVVIGGTAQPTNRQENVTMPQQGGQPVDPGPRSNEGRAARALIELSRGYRDFNQPTHNVYGERSVPTGGPQAPSQAQVSRAANQYLPAAASNSTASGSHTNAGAASRPAFDPVKTTAQANAKKGPSR